MTLTTVTETFESLTARLLEIQAAWREVERARVICEDAKAHAAEAKKAYEGKQAAFRELVGDRSRVRPLDLPLFSAPENGDEADQGAATAPVR